MGGVSVGRAIDYLISALNEGIVTDDATGAPVTVPPLSEIDAAVEVADVVTTTSDSPWVIIGTSGTDQNSDIVTTADYQVLGRQRISETYSIPGVVLVYGSGPDQKPVRDLALALMDGIVRLVWADPTLGGVLELGRIARVADMTLTQPPPAPGSGAGVAAEVSFVIQVENTYIPN